MDLVVQVSEDENLVIFTQPPNQVDKVKITDSTGTMTELLPIGNNAYSLIGFTPGAYFLDVCHIGDKMVLCPERK